MFCKNCGIQMEEDALFCTNCGCRKDAVEKALYCENCGKEISEDAMFCKSCGNKLVNKQRPQISTVYKKDENHEHHTTTPQTIIPKSKESDGLLSNWFKPSDKKRKTSVLIDVAILITLDFVKTYYTYKANTNYYDNDISFVYFFVRSAIMVLMGILVIHAIKKKNESFLPPAIFGTGVLILQLFFGIFISFCSFYRDIGYANVVYYAILLPGGLLVDNLFGLKNLESNPWLFNENYLQQFAIIIKVSCLYSIMAVLFFLQETIFSIRQIIKNKKKYCKKISERQGTKNVKQL